MSELCKHCKTEIRRLNFALNEEWRHVGNGGFNDHWLYCKINVATPPDPPPQPFVLCRCELEPMGPHVHYRPTDENGYVYTFLSCRPDGCEFVGGPTPCWADHK